MVQKNARADRGRKDLRYSLTGSTVNHPRDSGAEQMSLRLYLLAPFFITAGLTALWAAPEASSATRSEKLSSQERLRSQVQRCHLSKPPEGIPANDAREVTLDYENQCYRQLAEMAHAKLLSMQDMISRNRARKVRDRTLLQRKPLPDCHLSKPLEGVPENDAHLAALDYENQCYRQLAELELRKLDAIQKAARAPTAQRSRGNLPSTPTPSQASTTPSHAAR